MVGSCTQHLTIFRQPLKSLSYHFILTNAEERVRGLFFVTLVTHIQVRNAYSLKTSDVKRFWFHSGDESMPQSMHVLCNYLQGESWNMCVTVVLGSSVRRL